jgi:hypothetical protein
MPEELAYEVDAVNQSNRLRRLFENEDFNLLFTEGYMKEDMIQLAHNFGAQAGERTKLAEQMIARNVFKGYVDGILTAGFAAERTIREFNEDQREGE